MKLNPDCVRDLMLFLEDKTFIMQAGKTGGRFHAIDPSLAKDIQPLTQYSPEEILYHIIQLSESGYIVTDFKFNPHGEYSDFALSRVFYLTPKGHEFSASMDEQKHWEKAKKILASIGNVSLAVIEAVSSGVAGAAIDHLLNQGQ